MLEIIVYSMIWCFAVYGILVMIHEIIHQNTYKKVEDNIKLIITVKNAENGIENYIRDLTCSSIFCNDLVVIDLESEDDTMCILRQLENENAQVKVFNKNEGEYYLKSQVG